MRLRDLSLARKIFICVLALFLIVVGAMQVVGHVFARRGYAGVASAYEQAMREIETGWVQSSDALLRESVDEMRALAHDAARSLFTELEIAAGDALLPGEEEKFRVFARSQEGMVGLREFSLLTFDTVDGKRRCRVGLSTVPERVGALIPPAIWKAALATTTVYEDADATDFAFYHPLQVTPDLHRLRPDLQRGETYALLFLALSKQRMRAALEAGADARDAAVAAGRQRMRAAARSGRNQSAQASRLSLWAGIGTGLVGLVVMGAVLSVFVSRLVARPVRLAVTFADRVARGDLSRRMPVHANDELGQMRRSLNHMADSLESKSDLAVAISQGDLTRSVAVESQADALGHSLRTMVERLAEMMLHIKHHAGGLSTSSGHLLGVARSLADSASSTLARAHDIAAGSEQMSNTIEGVNTRTRELAHSTEHLHGATDELAASSGDIAESAERTTHIAAEAVAMTDEADAAMKQLAETAAGITDVAGAIKQISDQTNLLALNASIQAAQAGAAGRSFGVVADEIKELALQSAHSAETIAERIAEITERTDFTATRIAKVSSVVEQMGAAAVTVGERTQGQREQVSGIVTNLHATTAGIREISDSMDASARTSQEIATSIAEVANAMRTIEQRSESVDSTASELATINEQLDAMIARFKTGDG